VASLRVLPHIILGLVIRACCFSLREVYIGLRGQEMQLQEKQDENET